METIATFKQFGGNWAELIVTGKAIAGAYSWIRLENVDPLKIYHINDSTGWKWTMEIMDGGRQQRLCPGSVRQFLAGPVVNEAVSA